MSGPRLRRLPLPAESGRAASQTLIGEGGIARRVDMVSIGTWAFGWAVQRGSSAAFQAGRAAIDESQRVTLGKVARSCPPSVARKT